VHAALRRFHGVTAQSLQHALDEAGGPFGLLRAAKSGIFPFPIKSEFTNWRDEQESWRTTVSLMDQSHHMTDLTVEGPDTYRLLSDLAANSFEGYGPMRAKQLVLCNHDGYMIGDAIAFCLGENHVRIVGRPPAHNWVEFHATTADYDVTTRRDERTVVNRQGRELFRFQLQGPNAMQVLEKVNGGPLPEIPFFRMATFAIGGHEVTALNHRMSGFPGLEFWGAYANIDSVREALLEAGAEFGLREIGARAYASVATESGWIPSITPGVYTGDAMRPYREWLPARGFEGNVILGGSFVSDTVEDYYFTPWDLGYGFMVKFDHDFVGRAALERMAGEKHRTKTWLYWHRDDVARIYSSMYEQGDGRFKYLDIPAGFYASMPYDRVERTDGTLIGLSTTSVYSSNVRGWISLCTMDEDAVVHGDEVELVWGEPDGGSANLAVERHVQTRIRATIRPKPFSEQTQGSSLKS
jgi:vanillate/3-O-methylgallate O-demethylase